MFNLSRKSLSKLNGIHADLSKIVLRAIQLTTVDFMVVEGLRTVARQKVLVADGKSKTMNSRHLTGHAVDLYPLVNGRIDWPSCVKVVKAMQQAAKEFGIKIRCGADFNENGIIGDDKFYDGPHFELRRQEYP